MLKFYMIQNSRTLLSSLVLERYLREFFEQFHFLNYVLGLLTTEDYR